MMDNEVQRPICTEKIANSEQVHREYQDAGVQTGHDNVDAQSQKPGTRRQPQHHLPQPQRDQDLQDVDAAANEMTFIVDLHGSDLSNLLSRLERAGYVLSTPETQAAALEPAAAPEPATAPEPAAPAQAPASPVGHQTTLKAPGKARAKFARKPKHLSKNACIAHAFKVKTDIRRYKRKTGEPGIHRSRKLVPVHACAPEGSSGHLTNEVDGALPLIACPVAGCVRMVRGRKMLEKHLSAREREGGHNLVTTKTKGQKRMRCVAGRGRCIEEDGEEGIAAGGMTRHLVEHHTNVWVYCVACNYSSSREFNVWNHFEKEHESFPKPVRMREIAHEDLEEVEEA